MTGEGAASAPEGTFSGESYAPLLTSIFRRRISGLLTLIGEGATKKLYLGEGRILFASSNLPSERLGDILLARGIITRRQYEESAELLARTGRKQGTILVQTGAVGPKELFRGLILQVMEIVESPFPWEKGSWRHQSSYNRDEEMIALRLHPGPAIREGLWRVPPPPDILSWSGGTFLAAGTPPFEAEDIPLSPLEKKILSAAPRGKTPAEVADSARVPVDLVARAFRVLVGLGFLEPGARSSTRPGAEGAADGFTPLTVTAPPDDDFRSNVILLHAKLQRMDYYAILGLEDCCSPAEIKRAYIRKAREFHPDRFCTPRLEDLSRLGEEIFMKLTEAYNALSDERRRGEYDRALIPRGEGGRARREGDPAAAAAQFEAGLRRYKCGEAREAADAFRWAARLEPQNPLYHSWLGMALLRTGRRLTEAEEHLKTAIALDCNDPRLYLNLGLVYKGGRRWDEAAEVFRRALRLDPRHRETLREMEELSRQREEASPGDDSAILDGLFGS